MNVHLVKKELVNTEVLLKNDIEFHINRSIENGFIKKEIRFMADNKDHQHTEYVRFLTLDTFKKYIEEANLKLKHIFGDYNLNKFDMEKSSRLILVLE
jgi:hypothetical protein